MPPPVESSEPPSDPEQTIFFWVTYKPEEVNEGYWAVYRELALPRVLITIFCTSFALGVGGMVANAGNFEPINALVLIALAAFVFPPLLCLYAYLILRGRLMSSYDNRPNFHFPMMYTVSPLGCQIQYASGAGLLDWHHFSLALESPTFFCLASSVEDVFVLPKRCLCGADELEKARSIIKSHVRVFRRVSGGARNVDIAFEKAAIQVMVDQGIEEVVKLAEAAEAREHQVPGEEAATSAPTAKSLPEPAAIEQVTNPLKSGLAVEIAYQPGDIWKAEKIYFFRKRLIALALLYITYLIWMPLSFSVIGYIWGMSDYCQKVLAEVCPHLIWVIPVFFAQALSIYLGVRRRTKLSEAHATPIVFQFTEEGCGVRAGERYAVLAWWHFRECWETEDQFLVLVGRRGHAMYVIPKRVFPDQAGLRYLKQLLQRKVTKYRDLIG
ncbi:MAG: YcxB family protein [Cyanobacteria bacterium SZAS TMP-1]|nr:YcxB family protein [Cyanobacteria bacterium SZAS TMP-1]